MKRQLSSQLRSLTAVAAGLVLVGLSLGPAAPVGADATAAIHYPDLVTRPPTDLKLGYEGPDRVLYLSNTVWNPGPGRLVLHPHNNPLTSTTEAYQHLYDGNGNFVTERLAGTFDFHQAHDHWHFEDFAVYELLTRNGSALVAGRARVSQKTTFCIMDTTQYSTTVPHADPVRNFPNCGTQTTTQGLSVGWGDTYPYVLPGQWIEINGVPDGDYLLRSTADRENRIQEAATPTDPRETTNAAQVKVRIRKNRVRVG